MEQSDCMFFLEQVRSGDTFYRKSKPEVLYERIGALIERNGLGWAKLEGTGQYCEWRIIPEEAIDEDVQATDWTIHKGNLKEYRPSAKKPRLKPLVTEKTRRGWTYYDQVEMPRYAQCCPPHLHFDMKNSIHRPFFAIHYRSSNYSCIIRSIIIFPIK